MNFSGISIEMQQLYWREPLCLFIALFPLLIMLWRMAQNHQSLRRYADASLLPWVIVPGLKKRQYGQLILQFIIWLLLGMAAAGPRFLLSAPEELLPPQGAAVIVIDQSRSMLASDQFPNRLQQVHNIVNLWADENHELKLGLVIFAGASHIVLPPTSDKAMFKETARLLNEIQLPTHGSAFIEALLQAKSLLQNQDGSRDIIMLTDGDFSEEVFASANKIAADLRLEKIKLYLLGAGTPSPIALENTAGSWLQYKGKTVVTRLKETELLALAENNNIDYSRLNPDIHTSLLNVRTAQTTRIAAQYQSQVLWQELFHWCLVPALILIIFNHLNWSRLLLPMASVFIVIGIMQPQKIASANQAENTQAIQRAYLAWQNKDYTAAAEYYADLDGYVARMGEGASCFRDDQIECAINAFSRAAWEATDNEQRGRAAFNLGNSFFKQGDFKAAITLFKDALRYQPEQAHYQNNLDFSEEVQRNIERHLQLLLNRQGRQKLRQGWREVKIDENNEQISNLDKVLSKEKIDIQQAESGAQKLTEEQLAEFIKRSQAFARLSSRRGELTQRTHDWSRFSNKNPIAARKPEFWQRLFELEEDIPAHPETPKVLPGVLPW